MKRLAMAGAMVVAAVSALPAESRADWRVSAGVVVVGHDDGPRRSGPAFRYGYDRGWRDGSEEGHSDGRRSRDFRFWREGDYRHGDRGYKRWMGPKWDYVAGYRQGYESGYRRAYAAARPGWRHRVWPRGEYEGYRRSGEDWRRDRDGRDDRDRRRDDRDWRDDEDWRR
jgi:hypothetical protein